MTDFIARRIGFLHALILMLALLGGSIEAPAQELSKDHLAAVTDLAKVVTSGRTEAKADPFKSVGFTPDLIGVEEAKWRNWPAYRQVRTVYLAAEAHTPRSGGKVLAQMSSRLAQDYRAVNYIPSLKAVRKEFVVDPLASTLRFEFKSFDSNQVMEGRFKQIHIDAISEVARFADGNKLGGVERVMQEYCGLTRSQARDLLRVSDSSAEALKAAFERVPAPKRDASIKLVCHDLQRVSFEARVSKPINTINRWPGDLGGTKPLPGSGADLRPPRRGPPSGAGAKRQVIDLAPPRWTGGVAPKASPASTKAAVKSYKAFVNKSYPKVGSRGFRSMTRIAGGFGGVVFGSDWKAGDLGLPDAAGDKPTDVIWLPDGAEKSIGRLEFWFPSGDSLALNGVRFEDVRIAKQILDGVHGVEAFAEDRGLGLVGITDASPYFECGASEIKKEGRRWNVILHPALVDSDLGWCAVMVDILPICRSALLELVGRDADDEEVGCISNWLDSNTATWKFTDAAATISARNGRIEVKSTRTGPSSEYCMDLRGFAGITDGQSDESAEESEFRSRFLTALPVLMKVSHDFRRLEEFARVLTALRWSKSVGASIELPPVEEEERRTPTAIVITEDEVFETEALSPEEIEERQVDHIRQALPAVHEALSARRASLVGDFAVLADSWTAASTAAQATVKSELEKVQQGQEPDLSALFAAQSSLEDAQSDFLNHLESERNSLLESDEASDVRVAFQKFRSARADLEVMVMKLELVGEPTESDAMEVMQAMTSTENLLKSARELISKRFPNSPVIRAMAWREQREYLESLLGRLDA